MSDKNETDKLAIDIEEYTKKINEIDSKMAATYVHLSGRDIDNAVLRANGKKAKE